MNKIVGIQLRKNGKIYDFDSGHFVLKKGTKVVVNTEQGQAVGVVSVEPRIPEKGAPERPLKKVYRLANENDLEKYEKNCNHEKET